MQVVLIEWSRGEPNAAARAAIAAADVIVGVDPQDLREFTVFGTPSLESTISLKKPAAMRTLRVSLDCRAGGLQELILMVRNIKGRDDYEGSDA